MEAIIRQRHSRASLLCLFCLSEANNPDYVPLEQVNDDYCDCALTAAMSEVVIVCWT
jgi:hypothetical protein